MVAEGILSTNFGIRYLLHISFVWLAPVSVTLTENEDEARRLDQMEVVLAYCRFAPFVIHFQTYLVLVG